MNNTVNNTVKYKMKGATDTNPLVSEWTSTEKPTITRDIMIIPYDYGTKYTNTRLFGINIMIDNFDQENSDTIKKNLPDITITEFLNKLPKNGEGNVLLYLSLNDDDKQPVEGILSDRSDADILSGGRRKGRKGTKKARRNRRRRSSRRN